MAVGEIDALVAHDCVGAAEYATVEYAASDPGGVIELPIKVNKGHILLAALKYNCTALGCAVPAAASDVYTPDRITLLSADAVKIARLLEMGFEISSPPALHSLVRRIEDSYQSHATKVFRSFGRGHAIRVQGVLWRLQLAIDKQPGFLEPLDVACFDSARELGLLDRVGQPEMRSESSEHALETRELLGTFEEMTLIDLAEFVRAFEEKFDVTAAAPAAVVGAAGLGASAAESAEEEDEFDVIITGAGDKKIQVIKVVRELTSLGLKEAKDLVDSASQAVLERARKDIADKAAAALESAGAAVDVRRSAPV